jgi:transketolase
MSEPSTATPEMRRVLGGKLVDLGRDDSRIVVLDNDSDTTTESVQFRKAFPDRFLQMGIAEKNIFGTAAGLATSGFVPFPTIFATMAVRCALDQIAISICYPGLNVKIPGHYVGGSKAGASHIPVEDLAVMRSLPNMMVADPADNDELIAVMDAALEHDGPVYFRVSKLSHPALPGSAAAGFAWGRGRRLREGSDIGLVGTGMMTAACLAAADILEGEGISVDVIHLPSIKPIDVELIVETATRTRALVTVENASVIGGMGSAVTEVVAEHHPTRVLRVGIQDQWAHSGAIQDLLDHHGLRATSIAERAKAAVDAASSRVR